MRKAESSLPRFAEREAAGPGGRMLLWRSGRPQLPALHAVIAVGLCGQPQLVELGRGIGACIAVRPGPACTGTEAPRHRGSRAAFQQRPACSSVAVLIPRQAEFHTPSVRPGALGFCLSAPSRHAFSAASCSGEKRMSRSSIAGCEGDLSDLLHIQHPSLRRNAAASVDCRFPLALR
jgi:hypothetical protein